MFIKNFIILVITTGVLMSENLLKYETSPYLLQHKDNPVNWYPWGDKAFNKAKKENKLIFLSIGYSTCHWCHVMAHESFENDEVAEVLNKHFISIKVDKEQYPHIDRYYQQVYQVMNRRGGGWPLTIILNSNRVPFFSGTYIPIKPSYGLLGLIPMLNKLKDLPQDEISKVGKTITDLIDNINNKKSNSVPFDKNLGERATEQYTSFFDHANKGFSMAPKFPQATNIKLLLTTYKLNKNKDALDMAISSLTAMAKGGIYDQIEGGFYRYSVDINWEMPHFEKMLYTNAELLDVYLIAYKITKDELFKTIIIDTLAQIDKRFLQDDLYLSASNADSLNFKGESEEGFYFMYQYDESYRILEKNGFDKNNIEKSLKYLGITKDKFSNPHLRGYSKPENIKDVKNILLEIRKAKEYPFIDNKINLAWNSLYLSSKIRMGIFNKKYTIEAINSLDKLLTTLKIKGKFYHQTIKGVNPSQDALLEDYAFLIDLLFEAYQITLDEKYLTEYKDLIKLTVSKFYIMKSGKWRESIDDFNTYADISDSSYSSPLSILIKHIFYISVIDFDKDMYHIAFRSLSNFSEAINKQPSSYPNATITTLFEKYNPIFIKSNKKNLDKINLDNVDYPFVYKIAYKSDDYLACNFNSCFSYSKDFNTVKREIEKRY